MWAQRLDPLEQHLACRVNLLLAREEEEDVAGWFHEVDLEDGNERRFHVVWLGLFCVERFDREGTTGDGEDWASPKVGGKLGGVEGSRRADELELGPTFTSF